MGNIVIVDDMLNTRALMKDLMELARHSVVGEFENAIEALEFVKLEQPDLILLDYNLNTYVNGNAFTGIDLLLEIRKTNPKIKVIFVSAFAESDIIKNAMLRGAVDFIVKPFDGKDLINRVNRVVGH